MAKRPSFQFYPADWLQDVALRAVSISARGLWIDMLCLMHQCVPYGHLKVNGKVIHKVNLSRIVGLTLPELEPLLIELREQGVFDELEDGTMVSRRMVRDEKVRQSRAAGGVKGGNPALTKGYPYTQPPRLTSTEDEDEDEDEDSLSSSQGDARGGDRARKAHQSFPTCLQTERFRSAWDFWVKHRREIKKPLKPTQVKSQLKMLESIGEERAVAMIEHTVAMGWQGLREPETNNREPSASHQPRLEPVDEWLSGDPLRQKAP